MLLLSAVSGPQLGKITTYPPVQFSESGSAGQQSGNTAESMGTVALSVSTRLDERLDDRTIGVNCGNHYDRICLTQTQFELAADRAGLATARECDYVNGERKCVFVLT